ncbi:MAG: MATE family efflux transporter [Mogibacterium sp.]|nr:MATE family efflux transporter [Mogibacterium sp.]
MEQSAQSKKERSQEIRKYRMLKEPIPKVITIMAIPSIIAFLINSIYSLADTYFVSSLGNSATAAVSVNSSLDMFIMMAGSFVAIGANSYIARLLGAKNEAKASKVFSTAWVTAIIFGSIILAIGALFTEPLVRLLGATDTCVNYSIDYATYVLLVAPFMAANFVMNQSLRAEGAATLSMIGMGFGGILNCFLDPLFIFPEVHIGALVLPGLGLEVAGASIATALSKVVSFIILIFPYLSKRSMLHLSVKNIEYSKDIVKQVASVGSSSAFRTMLSVIAGIVLNNIAGGISDACLAGIGVTNKVMMFPFGIILGFGTGFQPVLGFNWGARRFDRVKESMKFSLRNSVVLGTVMGGLLFVFAESIIHLFAGTDPEMMQIGELAIRLQAAALPFHAWVATVNWACAGIGYAQGAVILATSRQGSCFLPIVWPLSHFFGSSGVASVQATADVLSVFIAIPMLRHVKGIIRRGEEEYLRESHGGSTV